MSSGGIKSTKSALEIMSTNPAEGNKDFGNVADQPSSTTAYIYSTIFAEKIKSTKSTSTAEFKSTKNSEEIKPTQSSGRNKSTRSADEIKSTTSAEEIKPSKSAEEIKSIQSAEEIKSTKSKVIIFI